MLRESAKDWDRVPHAAESGADFIDPDLDIVETRGNKPGQRYVRVVRSKKQGFEKVAPGWIQATRRTNAPKTPFARFRRALRRRILGAPLATRELIHERLTKTKALAVLSSDALSSVAYATEQISVVFVVAGGAGLAGAATRNGDDLKVMAAIAFLLFAVVLSYRQTIKAYPKGGGSYIVAKDNLGPLPGLIAVSVSSGVQYAYGLFSGLYAYRVPIGLACIIIIALGNLRGIRESGSIFAAPTYVFIASMLAMLVGIFFKIFTGQCSHGGCTVPPHLDGGGPASPLMLISLWLVLQAFASGCSAITGVEAISDGVLAFKQPEWRNARITLTVMGALLATMFIGITLATHITGIQIDNPNSAHYVPLISKLAAVTFGSTAIATYVTIGATIAILVLAANTAFSDFPRLFYFLARVSYAPHQFGRLGDRLAFSNGILVLTLLSAILVAVFQTDVSRLIPLYAIGVFLAFTMSQGGMVKRWWTKREPGWRTSIVFNFIGMCMTAVVFVVFAAVKFLEGAWVVCIIIPSFVAIFLTIHRHYTDVEMTMQAEIPTSPSAVRPVCLVPIADLNPIALQSLALARTISDTVVAIHICDDELHIAELRAKWDLWGNHVPLEIIESPFRSFVRPLLAYIDAIDKQRQDETLIIVLPELVANSLWHQLLHNQSALRLKAALLFRPGTVVVNVPYHLRRHARVMRRRRTREDEI